MDSHFPYSFVPWCVTHVHLSWPNPSYLSIPSHFIFPNKALFLPLPQTCLHFQTFPQIYQARHQWISALGKHFIVKAQQGARLSSQSNAQDPAPASIWWKTKRQSLTLLLQMLCCLGGRTQMVACFLGTEWGQGGRGAEQGVKKGHPSKISHFCNHLISVCSPQAGSWSSPSCSNIQSFYCGHHWALQLLYDVW